MAVLCVVSWLLAIVADGPAGWGIVRGKSEEFEDIVLAGSSASALLTTVVVPSVVPVIVLAFAGESVESLPLFGGH